TLKADMDMIKGDVQTLKEGQQRLEAKVERVEEKVDNLATEMRSHFRHIENMLHKHQAALDLASREFSSKQASIDYLMKKVTEHDMEIFHLKNYLQP
ncbi:hypothetical protein ABEH79_10555, partial [Geobacillus thermopakistaniensis]